MRTVEHEFVFYFKWEGARPVADDRSGTTLHHAGLPVADLERALAWYRDALGLEHTTTARVPEGVEIAFVVDASGAGVELFALELPAVDEWDGPITALRRRVGHVAFTVGDLDDAFARAVAAGGRAVWAPRPSPNPGQRIAFVTDPDGNLVELMSG
jgi:catechol 2,3-dioxygenase-like lactoylglutathione lyase family enzyme